ncbi:hypothetical protein FNF29_03388 [Cafeteria roenbergensis]|uniref:Large ribosomal subunit protein uL10-like insertion domain-containing protein n=1 Tax=Cafeteria roenbergensis TaxID=33653 RepID=A0A5A8CM65_CAFRO|nr:hypothetical protein FNF29_03388 [Cafeteria roenbergensis]|eukprot:KAA0153200.1 hypothetical protein FNF29_03388 [Cafeteria roenbergensis]
MGANQSSSPSGEDLYAAAEAGSAAEVGRLLSEGAPVNWKHESMNQRSALERAAACGHLEVARLLLSHGADIEARDIFGQTPLVLAAKKGHLSIAELLLDAGADVNAKSKADWTALTSCALRGWTDLARLLLAHGADTGAVTSNGWTAITLCGQQGHPAIARLLLDSGADVKARSKNGLTALHLACSRGDLDTTRVLLEKGANPMQRLPHGRTTLQACSGEDCRKLIADPEKIQRWSVSSKTSASAAYLRMPVSDRKRAYGKRLIELLETHRAVLLVSVDNVGSKQIQDVRLALRDEATVLMGKNTTIRRVFRDYFSRNPDSPHRGLADMVGGNMGFVFTNGDVAKVRETILSFKVPAPARTGSVAPADVFIEPGPTGCDPGQTAWFQALNIPTKIQRGQIEMIARVHLIKEGEKVTDSSSALLQKLDIKPFAYSVVVHTVYDDGEIFDAAVLDLTEANLITKLLTGADVIAALGLELGVPTKCSIKHSINTAYKACLAVGLGTEYKWAAVTEFEAFFKNPGAFGPAPAAAAAAVVEEEEEEEEEESVAAGGMFGGSDDSSS